MIALLTIALCWAFRTGERLEQEQAILIKSYGRKAKSIFRYEFDYLRKTILDLELSADEFLQVLKLLSCT